MMATRTQKPALHYSADAPSPKIVPSPSLVGFRVSWAGGTQVYLHDDFGGSHALHLARRCAEQRNGTIREVVEGQEVPRTSQG